MPVKLHDGGHPWSVVAVTIRLSIEEPLQRMRISLVHVVGTAGLVVPLVLRFAFVGILRRDPRQIGLIIGPLDAVHNRNCLAEPVDMKFPGVILSNSLTGVSA